MLRINVRTVKGVRRRAFCLVFFLFILRFFFLCLPPTKQKSPHLFFHYYFSVRNYASKGPIECALSVAVYHTDANRSSGAQFDFEIASSRALRSWNVVNLTLN